MPNASLTQVLLAVLFLVAGPVFLFFSARQYRRGVALDEHGVPATAHVTRIAAGSDTDTGYVVDYVLEVNGVEYADQSRHVSQEDLDTARVTGSLVVRYVPDDPAVHAPLHGTQPRSLAMGGGALGALFTLIGVGLAVLTISTKLRTGRLWA